MAEKKINITELSGQVAEQCKVKTGDAKRFLMSLNAALKEALNADEIVKISGLGTFKVITTEPRKSVDVNTGAEITIGSYRKVSFTPEQSVKNMLNTQFEELPALEVDDDFELRVDDKDDNPTTDNTDLGLEDSSVQLASSETIDEIKNLLAAINGGTTDGKEEERKEENEGQGAEEKVEKEGEGDVITEQKDTDLTSGIQEDTNVNADNQTVPTVETADEPDEQSSPAPADNETIDEPQPSEKKKKESKTSFWKIALLMIVIFSVIFGLFYFLLIRHIDKWTKEYVAPAQEQVDSQYGNPDEPAAAPSPSIESPAEQTEQTEQAEETQAQTEPVQEAQASAPVNSGAGIAQSAPARTTETVIVGSRLTQISRRHYGHPEFWIYIYLANKDKFPNGPNSVVIGTKLIIPDMPAEMVDPNSPEAIARAQELQETL